MTTRLVLTIALVLDSVRAARCGRRTWCPHAYRYDGSLGRCPDCPHPRHGYGSRVTIDDLRRFWRDAKREA